MLWRPRHISRNSLVSVYAAAFFLSLHMAIITYIDSTFLTKSFGEDGVGGIFIAGSAMTIALLTFAPRILRALGNYAAAVIFSVLEAVTLVGLPFFQDPVTVGILFILHIAFSTFLFFNFDVFTENGSHNETTGNTRGIFLTTQNVAIVFGPILAGVIMNNTEEFFRVYLSAAALLLPVLLILSIALRDFRDPVYHEIKWIEGISDVWKNKDIRLITFANFLLQFFYGVMVIYMPMYLNLHMGFTWSEIGFIFGIMLLPFVLLEIPLGRIADDRLGEQEILTAGFFLISITTFSVSFLTEHSIYLWAALLFMTRMGAAAIEIMTETYFFKKVDSSDAGILSIFRHVRPLAFIIAPAVVTLFLLYFPLRYVFLALGMIMLLGAPLALIIHDTK